MKPQPTDDVAHFSSIVRRGALDNDENVGRIAEEEIEGEEPDDYNDEIKETVNRIDYDLLYGEENEEDNSDYNYNYGDEDSTTDEPSTTEYPYDEGVVIIGTVDTSDQDAGGPVGPRSTIHPGK